MTIDRGEDKVIFRRMEPDQFGRWGLLYWRRDAAQEGSYGDAPCCRPIVGDDFKTVRFPAKPLGRHAIAAAEAVAGRKLTMAEEEDLLSLPVARR